MWLVTKVGFFSVVYKPEDGPRLTIRARAPGDLERLRQRYLPKLGKITESDVTDYRYRAFATRQQVAAAVGKIALEIDYPNFKDEVFLEQGSFRSSVYHRVWAALLDLQPLKPRARRRAAG